jgi:hypothetical protein
MKEYNCIITLFFKDNDDTMNIIFLLFFCKNIYIIFKKK